MRKLLFSALISAAFFCNANAQSLEETMALGDSLLYYKRFADAVKMYERVLFFAPDSLKTKANIGLGRAYFGMGDYKHSADAYSSATDITKIDSAHYTLLVEKVRAELWGKYFGRAERTLSLIDTSAYPSFAKRRIFYTGVLHYSAENYDMAESEFLKLATTDEAGEINKLFKKLRRSERRSAKTAMRMSLLLPGSGQIYAGRPEDAVNALLLNGAWVALTVTTYQIYGPFHAAITAFPWLFRYYTGSAENAAVLMMKMKEERRDKIYGKVLKIVAG
jgi:tetratricopeptide (TPR) repeat protein